MAASGLSRRWMTASSTCEPAVSASAASSASERSASACVPLGPHADQHHALESQLSVLDLGDVGELGGQPRHPAERAALLTDVGAGRLVGLVERHGLGGCRHRLQRCTPQRLGHLSCHRRVQHIARPECIPALAG